MRYVAVSVFLAICLLHSPSLSAQKHSSQYKDSLQKELHRAKEDPNRSDILSLLAAAEYQGGDYAQSLQYSLQALKLSKQLKDNDDAAANLVSIGKNYQALAENKTKQLPDSLSSLAIATRLQRAHTYLVQAIDVQKENGSIDVLADAYEHLSRVQLLQGDTMGSRASFKKYNDYLAGVYNKDKGHEVTKKDMKEVFSKKQEALKKEGEQKQLALQNELQLNALAYEYEKKQAEAKTEKEKDDLRHEQEMRQKQIAYEFERKKEAIEAEKEKSDAVNAVMFAEAKKERNYYIAGIVMLGLLAAGMLNRFNVLRKNRTILEQKNKQIAQEKENADMMRMRAESSERFKQQFLANMSHEIRTPMNAVSGMTELLLDKDPRPDQLSYLQAISKSSDILLHIINDILDLSKIEAGKMELEAIDFSITDTLRQVKDTLAHRADEKGLQLVTTITGDVCDVVVGDPYRLNQVLINLTGNAIKFTEKGGVQIDVRHHNTDGDKVSLLFAITDTGIGIPEDKVKTLFESFTQVNNSDTRKYGGTGLGLSISKQLVELHGGCISVESVQGKGTTFSFVLNYKTGSDEKLQQRIKQEKNADGSCLNGLRILVADDNEYNRLVVSETLRLKADVIIEMVVNGEEAVRMMEQYDFDVVLMDVQMPVMNGLEATTHIRMKLDHPKNKVPVVALTGGILRSEIDKCIDSGMNSYIPKPFKAWQLINTIADVAGRKPSAGATGHSNGHNNGNGTGKNEKLKSSIKSGTVTDFTYLKQFCEGNEDRMKKYIRIYLEAVPLFRQNMLAATATRNMNDIKHRIHAFKPNWMIMGMKRTSETGVAMEHLCEQQNEKVFEMVDGLLADIELSVQELAGKSTAV